MKHVWPLSLGGAVACHLAVLFGWPVTLSPPVQPRPNPAVEVTLVAAPPPAPPRAVIARPVPVIQPAPPVKVPRLIPPPVIAVKNPAPLFTPVPAQISPARPLVAKASSPVMAIGDGTSPKIGLDATTQKAPPVVIRAEPNYLKNPEPDYPLTARRRHEQGLVLLTVKVSALGRAVNVQLKRSSGHPLLDQAALNAVQDWEFSPARTGSATVESEIEVPVRFKMAE